MSFAVVHKALKGPCNWKGIVLQGCYISISTFNLLLAQKIHECSIGCAEFIQAMNFIKFNELLCDPLNSFISQTRGNISKMQKVPEASQLTM